MVKIQIPIEQSFLDLLKGLTLIDENIDNLRLSVKTSKDKPFEVIFYNSIFQLVKFSDFLEGCNDRVKIPISIQDLEDLEQAFKANKPLKKEFTSEKEKLISITYNFIK